MRQTLSGWRCISADWPVWNDGSNQKRRSVGIFAAILMSAIRNLSSKVTPENFSPSRSRVVERAPSAAISQSASSV